MRFYLPILTLLTLFLLNPPVHSQTPLGAQKINRQIRIPPPTNNNLNVNLYRGVLTAVKIFPKSDCITPGDGPLARRDTLNTCLSNADRVALQLMRYFIEKFNCTATPVGENWEGPHYYDHGEEIRSELPEWPDPYEPNLADYAGAFRNQWVSCRMNPVNLSSPDGNSHTQEVIGEIFGSPPTVTISSAQLDTLAPVCVNIDCNLGFSTSPFGPTIIQKIEMIRLENLPITMQPGAQIPAHPDSSKP